MNQYLRGEFLMKTIFLNITGMCFLFLLTGCSGFGIAFIDVNTLKIDTISSGHDRESIISVNEDKKEFYTIQRPDSGFILRIRDFNGKIKEETPIPPIFTWYYGMHTYTFAVKERGIVYFNNHSKSLNLYKIDLKNDTCLIKNLTTSVVCLYYLKYIPPDDLIIILDEDETVGRLYPEIIRYSFNTQKIIRLYTAKALMSSGCALSPDNKLLAFWEGIEQHDIYGNIKVMDLSTNKIVFNIECDDKALVGNICWSSSGDKIGYTESDNIKTFDIKTGKIELVKAIPREFTTYYLTFVGNKKLAYRLGTRNWRGALEFIDIKGNYIKDIDVDFCSEIFGIDSGKKIIGDVGYSWY